MKQEKKRWYFVRKTINGDGWQVLSKVFYAFDEKYLYEKSGKRTPRVSSWRTWYDSEVSAVGTFFSFLDRQIASHKRELARLEKCQKTVAPELNRLIDASVLGGSHA